VAPPPAPAEEGQIGAVVDCEDSEECGGETNLEVGEVLTTRRLPRSLALVMEGWADWLLAVPQFKAKVYVFCDGLPESSRQLFERCGVDVGPWLAVESFWEHGVLEEDGLCFLVSGSPGFVEECVSRVPEGIETVAAIVGSSRARESKGRKRLRWRTLRHQDVGGVTTVRCSLGFPHEWREFKPRPHVQRRVKHVIVHSERPVPIKGDPALYGRAEWGPCGLPFPV
jgi:hypothetical protein